MKKIFFCLSRMVVVFSLVLSLCPLVNAAELKNGRTLKVVNDDVPLEYVSLVFAGGAGLVTSEKQGLTHLLAEIFERGPKSLSEQEYKRQLFMNNLSIGFGANNRAFVASIAAPKEKLASGVQMVKRILASPKFETGLFEEIRAKATEQTVSRFERMSSFIFHFGPDKAFKAHPAFRDGVGTPSTFKKITLSDLQNYHRDHISLSEADVFVLGGSSKADVAGVVNEFLLENVKAGSKKEMELPLVSWKKFTQEKMLFHKKQAADNQILWIMPFDVKPYSRDYAVAQLAMQVLGGSQGHLTKVLREQRGLTYHAGSYLRRINRDQSYWMIYTFGKTDNVPKLLRAIPEVFAALKKTGASEQELTDAKNKIRTSIKKSYELPKDELDYIVRAHLYGFPKDGIDLFLKYVDEVQLSDVNRFIDKSLDLKKAKKFVMGDKKQVSKYFKEAKIVDSQELL